MQNRSLAVAGVALVVGAGVSACGGTQTVPRPAAHVTIDGYTHVARPAACSQEQSYRTINIPDRDGELQATVLLSGERVIPQWVRIRNVDGFTGSFWQGGVGQAHVDLSRGRYTIIGSAYGINTSNPNKVVTTDFKIVADC
ncbi:hypothetical protein MB901379_02563 [Mycobacterium basiliense]|uniref:Mycobacterium 19 kDa lipoprotein antigen n=1 Tax=Mycobacterium basiliense TaxID=2094119 RepID=A0A3S4BWC6_9MYCO|nr:lipoprotein LpqH [Mycobacterium basiliense]VDM88996.1 hypothetical protein MB901379_02563 [Mycobacterium basiliense]